MDGSILTYSNLKLSECLCRKFINIFDKTEVLHDDCITDSFINYLIEKNRPWVIGNDERIRKKVTLDQWIRAGELNPCAFHDIPIEYLTTEMVNTLLPLDGSILKRVVSPTVEQQYSAVRSEYPYINKKMTVDMAIEYVRKVGIDDCPISLIPPPKMLEEIMQSCEHYVYMNLYAIITKIKVNINILLHHVRLYPRQILLPYNYNIDLLPDRSDTEGFVISDGLTVSEAIKLLTASPKQVVIFNVFSDNKDWMTIIEAVPQVLEYMEKDVISDLFEDVEISKLVNILNVLTETAINNLNLLKFSKLEDTDVWIKLIESNIHWYMIYISDTRFSNPRNNDTRFSNSSYLELYNSTPESIQIALLKSLSKVTDCRLFGKLGLYLDFPLDVFKDLYRQNYRVAVFKHFPVTHEIVDDLLRKDLTVVRHLRVVDDSIEMKLAKRGIVLKHGLTSAKNYAIALSVDSNIYDRKTCYPLTEEILDVISSNINLALSFTHDNYNLPLGYASDSTGKYYCFGNRSNGVTKKLFISDLDVVTEEICYDFARRLKPVLQYCPYKSDRVIKAALALDPTQIVCLDKQEYGWCLYAYIQGVNITNYLFDESMIPKLQSEVKLSLSKTDLLASNITPITEECCIVCYLPTDNYLKCGHKLCESCTVAIMAKCQSTCPMCSKKIKPTIIPTECWNCQTLTTSYTNCGHKLCTMCFDKVDRCKVCNESIVVLIG